MSWDNSCNQDFYCCVFLGGGCRVSNSSIAHPPPLCPPPSVRPHPRDHPLPFDAITQDPDRPHQSRCTPPPPPQNIILCPVPVPPRLPNQVTAASVTSTACPEGWLYSADTDHCYFKSPNTAKAESQADAVSKCKAEGAWVIAINSNVRYLFFFIPFFISFIYCVACFFLYSFALRACVAEIMTD